MLTPTRLLTFCILMCSIYRVISVKKDVVFVVDKSGSIAQADFDTAIDFLKDVVTALTIGTGDVQVSVVSFSDSYNEEFDLDDYTTQANLLTAIDGLKSSITTNGGTFTADALNYVQSTSFTAGKGVRGDADPIVVVMTDGLSQNAAETTTAADLIRSSITGSIIYVIGIGSDLSSTTQELLNIASDPDSDNVLYVTYFNYICNLVPNIAAKIDSSVSLSVAGDCDQTTTTVFVGKGGGAVTTATTTTTTTTTTASSAGASGESSVFIDSDEGDDTAIIAGVTTAAAVAAVGAAGGGLIYRLNKKLWPFTKLKVSPKKTTAWA